MYCKYCGAKVANGEPFCQECGSPVQREQQVTQSAEHTQQANRPVAEKHYPEHAKKRSSIPECRKEFAISPIAPWVRGMIQVDRNAIRIRTANVILGLIPAGEDNQTIALSNVSNAAVSTSYRIGLLVFGIFIALIGLLTFPSGKILMALILLAIGSSMALNGIQTRLWIAHSGGDFIISVPFYEKNTMNAARTEIDKALVFTETKKDSLFATKLGIDASSKNTQKIVDAINTHKN